MDQRKSNLILMIDATIRFRGKIYRLTIGNILKWLIPLIVIVSRLILWLRPDGS